MAVKYNIRVVYKLGKEFIIMKTFGVDKQQIECCSDDDIIESIMGHVVRAKGRTDIDFRSFIICDENDDILRVLI